MKNNTASFLVSFSIYTIIILLISLAVSYFLPVIPISSSWPTILVFLYLFTTFAFHLLVKYIQGKLSHFANAFMLVNFGKLILFSAVIFIYAWLYHDDAISFAATFFVYYLLLTSYEITALLKIKKIN